MAYFGLRKPYIAKYDKLTGRYSDGFKCAKAVKFDCTPSYVSGSISGDDEVAEQETAFKDAAVTLGTTDLPLEAADVCFGHTVDKQTKKVIKKTTDESNNVGVGVIVPQVIDGQRSYVGFIVTCVKFQESAESFTTKGDSITFSNPSISGTAIADKDSQWEVKQAFTDPDEAETFVKTYLGITEQAGA